MNSVSIMDICVLDEVSLSQGEWLSEWEKDLCLAEAVGEGNSAWQKLSQREDFEQVDGLFSSSIDASP